MSAIEKSGEFLIGGDLRVRRFGYGAMRLTGPGIWGPPEDPANARRVLYRAVELGINLIDTADVYGPRVNEQLIRDALAPYPPGLVIATKGGLVRTGPATQENPSFSMNGTPEHLRAAVDQSLFDLGLETIDLYQLHRVDPATRLEETMGALKDMRDAGKIRHIGLSQVSIEEIEQAQAVVQIATVQNIYNVKTRDYDAVVDYCAANAIGFIPFWPVGGGDLTSDEAIAAIARRYGMSPAQIALAWLLQRSPTMLPIAGTSSVAHLEENVAACGITIEAKDVAALDALAN